MRDVAKRVAAHIREAQGESADTQVERRRSPDAPARPLAPLLFPALPALSRPLLRALLRAYTHCGEVSARARLRFSAPRAADHSADPEGRPEVLSKGE